MSWAESLGELKTTNKQNYVGIQNKNVPVKGGRKFQSTEIGEYLEIAINTKRQNLIKF